MYNLTHWYDSGEKGSLKDVPQSMKWCKQSSNLHYWEAISLCGYYRIKDVEGMTKEIEQGLALVERAANEGVRNAR